MTEPDGNQFTITSGGTRAVVTARGATLRAFEVDGVPYLETWADSPPLGSGNVLVPWPNRVAGATWTHAGQVQHLDVTEPARGNASHGLVRKLDWTATEQQRDRVTLEVSVGPCPGWPFRFRTTIRYAVDSTGLRVTHRMHNLGDQAMPFGVGTHPYPRPGRADLDDCVLTLAATTSLPLDQDSMVPLTTTPEPITEPVASLRGVVLDDAFGGCLPGADGLVRHRLAGLGGGVEVWAQDCFRWVQVFTPPEFPGRTGRAIAIEPMTCPPDALNSGIDLLWVEPGETWTGQWGISALGSNS